MAAPAIQGTPASSRVTTAATPWTLTLPASITNGERVIVFITNSSGATFTTPSGWTAITNLDNVTNGAGDVMHAIYRECDGSEGTTLSITPSASSKGVWHSYRISGHNPSIAPIAPAISNGGAISNPDPPNASGLTSDDYLVFAWSSMDGETQTITTYPTNYNNNTSTNNTGTGGLPATNSRSAVGSRQLTGITSEDPGTFAWSAVAQSGTGAATIANRAATSTQGLTGTLFTKAPTFNTGAITSVRNLAGSLFTKAPTFFTGTVSATYNLGGSLFQKAPTFFTGTISTTVGLTGSLFQKAPTFFTGALGAPVQELTGTLFQLAPTFNAGAITATYGLSGTLFQEAPTFFTGAMSQTGGGQPLTGSLFQRAPTFFTGAITVGPVGLTGTLFQKSPDFLLGGVVSGTYGLTGTLFQKSPTFFVGTITRGPVNLSGVLFQKAPTFNVGILNRTGGGETFTGKWYAQWRRQNNASGRRRPSRHSRF